MKFLRTESRLKQRGTPLASLILQILRQMVLTELCAGTTQMTTPLTTTAQGFVSDPSLQSEAKENFEVLVRQSFIHIPYEVSQTIEREEDKEFPYLDSYEVEPPETVPNREWKMQKRFMETEINSGPSLSHPYGVVEDKLPTTTESAIQALQQPKPPHAEINRKIRSKRRPNKCAKFFPKLDNSVFYSNCATSKVIHDLVDHFEKTAKLYALGLNLFLKRTAPSLCNEKETVTKQDAERFKKHLQTNSSLSKTLKQYQSLKQIYLEHVNRVQVIYTPDLFLERVISRYKPTGLDDVNGVQVMLKKLVKSIERAGSVIKHIDMEIEKNGRYSFYKNNECGSTRNKALERIFTVSELSLKVPSSKSIVEAIRISYNKSSFLEKVKIVSGLFEHHVLNDMVVHVLKTLLNELENNSCSCSETEEESTSAGSMSSLSGIELSKPHKKVHHTKQVVPNTDINEFNISKFSDMVLKKFKDYVIEEVTQDMASEMKRVFTVPFMVPYVANFTSATTLTETIIKKVKEVIKHLKLSRLFANFKGSWEQNKEFEQAIHAAEENIINAVVPVLLKTGNNLVKRYATPNPNKSRHGIRSPIRKKFGVKTNRQLKGIHKEQIDFDWDENLHADNVAVSNLLRQIIDEGATDSRREIEVPNQEKELNYFARNVFTRTNMLDKPFE